MRNYGINLVKKCWFEGKYSYMKLYDEVLSNYFGFFSMEIWGLILDMEI